MARRAYPAVKQAARHEPGAADRQARFTAGPADRRNSPQRCLISRRVGGPAGEGPKGRWIDTPRHRATGRTGLFRCDSSHAPRDRLDASRPDPAPFSAMEKRSHLGMAGHHAAMSELLYRGYNVAAPAECVRRAGAEHADSALGALVGV